MEYPRDEELLSAYLDRELTPDERRALDRLLESSAAARARLIELEATSRFLRQVPRLTLDTDFADLVIDRLRSESILRPEMVVPERPPRSTAWRYSGALAAAAAVVLAVWLSRPERERLGPENVRQPDATNAIAGINDEATPFQRDRLDVGDALDVVGPNGENRFRLIVFGKGDDGEAMRCVLVDTRHEQPVESNPPAAVEGASDPEMPAPLALRANTEQLELLAQAYDEANLQSDEAFPVVDITASMDPDDLIVRRIRPHTSADPSRRLRAGGENQPFAKATESADNRVADTASDPVAQQLPPSRTRVAQASPRSEPAENIVEQEAERLKDAAPGRTDGIAGRSAQSERVQTTLRIESVRTSDGVRKLAELDWPRMGVSERDNAIQQSSRVKVLLRINRPADQDRPSR